MNRPHGHQCSNSYPQQPSFIRSYARMLLLLLGIQLLLVACAMLSLLKETSHADDLEEIMFQPQREELGAVDERRLNSKPNVKVDGQRRKDIEIESSRGRGGKAPGEADREKQQQHEPLNIVLFYADDWSFRTLGAMERALKNTKYKVPEFVKTPNIDKMAENGVLFTHNCVTTSICMVSRATLYTGQYASRHKTFLPEHREMYADGVWNSTLFPLLKAQGYENAMIGKWHHSKPPNAHHDFALFRGYFGQHWMERNGEKIHVTDANEQDAIEFLQKRRTDKPFALLVSFFAIHAEDGNPEQYRPQNRTSHLYQNESVPIPKTATEDHFRQMPPFLQKSANVGRGRWNNRYRTPEMYQHMMKKTYRMITEVDTAVGNIMEKLREQNVLDNTLLIFTTDNGNLHGEHGLCEKWYPYEESIRVPLVIVDPRMPKSVRNSVNDEFTLNIDLAPTMLQAAKIPIPDVMQGQDIALMYLDEASAEIVKQDWRKQFYYEWFTGHKVVIPASLALVAKDVKYIIYPEYEYEELFCLSVDPYEERNIYNTSVQLLEEVKGRFNEFKRIAESGVKV